MPNLLKQRPSKKRLYFIIHNGDTSATMELSGCLAWIKADMEGLTEEDTKDLEFTLSPIWLTTKEFNNLPEASI